MKERRDANCEKNSGARKPNQRVPWFVGKNLTDVMIVKIDRVFFYGEDFDLRKVDFLEKEQVKALPKGDGSPAYLCDPTKYTQYIDGKLKEYCDKIKKTTGKAYFDNYKCSHVNEIGPSRLGWISLQW